MYYRLNTHKRKYYRSDIEKTNGFVKINLKKERILNTTFNKKAN